MIEPSEMNISALNPTVRRSPVPVVTTGGWAVVDMALPGHVDRASLASHGPGTRSISGMVRICRSLRDPDK